VILQQTVEPEQMKKLLESGRTDILRNFVSNRTRRKFAAFLVWKADEGKVGFEFEPRGKGGAKATVVTAEEPAPAGSKRATRRATAEEPPPAKRAAAGARAKTAKRSTTAKSAAAKKAAAGTAARKTSAARKSARR
jgi:DNA topoisomerase-3